MKTEPLPSSKRVKKARKQTERLITALNNLKDEDRFYPHCLKALLWQLSMLKKLLEREEEKIAIKRLKRLQRL